MTISEGSELRRPMMTRRGLKQMVLGFFLGGFTAYGLIRLAELFKVNARHFTWSDWLAAWLGCCCLGIGVVTYALTYNRRELAKQIESESEPMPATNEEVHLFRLQGLVVALAGVMILLPLFAMGTMGQTVLGARMTMTAILLLFALQTFGNVKSWQGSDEFQRDMMLKTGALTFGIGQGALFLWAAAEHLHLAPAITSWQIITLLLTLYLGTGCVIAVRTRM